jgi:competence protein ComEC
LYADALDIKLVQKLKRHLVLFLKIKARIIHNLEKITHKTELNVAVALIMGQQQDIDPDIIRDYQYAAVHILSVSGLHIGFFLKLLY